MHPPTTRYRTKLGRSSFSRSRRVKSALIRRTYQKTYTPYVLLLCRPHCTHLGKPTNRPNWQQLFLQLPAYLLMQSKSTACSAERRQCLGGISALDGSWDGLSVRR